MEQYNILELMRLSDMEIARVADWYNINIDGKRKQPIIYEILEAQAKHTGDERPVKVKKVLK